MTLTIGQLARSGGATVETIRYYEREGLLEAPGRSKSGYRAYEADAVQRLVFIHRAQELGFTLKEIRDLIALQTDETADCTAVRAAALEKGPEMYKTFRAKEDGCIKVVLKPGG